MFSRKPIWLDVENFGVNAAWETYWNQSLDFFNKYLVDTPHQKLNEFNLNLKSISLWMSNQDTNV